MTDGFFSTNFPPCTRVKFTVSCETALFGGELIELGDLSVKLFTKPNPIFERCISLDFWALYCLFFLNISLFFLLFDNWVKLNHISAVNHKFCPGGISCICGKIPHSVSDIRTCCHVTERRIA